MVILIALLVRNRDQIHPNMCHTDLRLTFMFMAHTVELSNETKCIKCIYPDEKEHQKYAFQMLVKVVKTETF